MMQLDATVFSSFDVSRVRGVYQRGVEICFGNGLAGVARETEIVTRCPSLMGLARARLILARLTGTGDGAASVSRIVADKLFRAIDDHLRGVDAVDPEAKPIAILAVGELVRGEAVAPAELVPVIHMLAERDDLYAIHGLRAHKLCQQRVGGRATGAAFRGEELYKDRSTALPCFGLCRELMPDRRRAARVPATAEWERKICSMGWNLPDVWMNPAGRRCGKAMSVKQLHLERPPNHMTTPAGIYISVPFCKAKCTFCNFASGVFAAERMQRYVDRVCDEIGGARATAAKAGAELPERVDTVYFGGGTPSLLEATQFRQIFERLRGEFDLADDAEITLECAPGQLADETLAELLRQGMNRVSFGVQSFVDKETAAVGRLHTREQCEAEIARLRAAGVEEINLDLIAGLPYQTQESWQYSVEQAIAQRCAASERLHAGGR